MANYKVVGGLFDGSTFSLAAPCDHIHITLRGADDSGQWTNYSRTDDTFNEDKDAFLAFQMAHDAEHRRVLDQMQESNHPGAGVNPTPPTPNPAAFGVSPTPFRRS